MRSPEACVLIRDLPVYRRESFCEGIRRAGYHVSRTPMPLKGNALVIWNRYGAQDQMAKCYERAGGVVFVAENGYLGREFGGAHWYALARGQHNGAGEWASGGPERWASLDVEVAPWRSGGSEVVVLATRHIGPEGVAEPRGWAQRAADELHRAGHRVRLRAHPGEQPHRPLAEDLEHASAVVTWGSGGALKALTMGIPVFYGFRRWIGAAAATPYEPHLANPFHGERRPMFERLAWAMWRTDEIATGAPFRCPT